MVKWFPNKSKSKNAKKFRRIRSMCGILTFFVPSQFTNCLKFLELLLVFKLLGYSLNRFITLRRCSNDIRKKSKSKNTKKLTNVQRMWGILTFFVPSQFSTCLKFLKFVGTSYGLDVVWIGSLHLGGGQMISGKIQIQKY